MRNVIAEIVTVAALTLVPAIGFAAGPQRSTPAAKPSQTKVANHTTTGVVKSINATTLVITPSGKTSGDMTFALNASTHREGPIEVGAPVSIRYRDESGAHVATAIALQHPKPQPHQTSQSPR